MKTFHFLPNGRSLIRQAIMAWIILLVSIVTFAIWATFLSLLWEDERAIIVVALILVLPFIVFAHIYLQSQNYDLTESIIIAWIRARTKGWSPLGPFEGSKMEARTAMPLQEYPDPNYRVRQLCVTVITISDRDRPRDTETTQ